MAPARVLAVELGMHVDNRLVWRVKVLTSTSELRSVVTDEKMGGRAKTAAKE